MYDKIFTLLLALSGSPAIASGPLQISDAWIAEAPPVSRVHAGYMKLENLSSDDVLLIRAASEAYDRVEIHLSSEQDGVASMQRVEAVSIAAGDSVSFEPGGYHLMLIGPRAANKAGDRISITLGFDDNSMIDVLAEVRKHGDGDHSHHQHHH